MPISRRRSAFAVVLVATTSLGANPAAAAGQRSFVATSGVDNPACSLAAPCRTFGAALAATSPGGEVIVLDSGGYGAVAIAQSVSIIAPPGVYAGISVFSGHGITISAGASDTVVLRGLAINNQGSTGRGIYVTGAGLVRIEDVQVSGFTAASGLNAVPASPLQLQTRRSVFRGNGIGVALNSFDPAATAQITGTLEAVEVSNSNGDGVAIGNNIFLALSRSLVTKNAGFGVGFGPTAGQFSRLNVDDCEISANAVGLFPGDTPGTTFLHVTRSRIIENGTGLDIGGNSTTRIADSIVANNIHGILLGTGAIESAGNNVLRGNVDGEAAMATFPLR